MRKAVSVESKRKAIRLLCPLLLVILGVSVADVTSASSRLLLSDVVLARFSVDVVASLASCDVALQSMRSNSSWTFLSDGEIQKVKCKVQQCKELSYLGRLIQCSYT